MDFTIDKAPPTDNEIAKEREFISGEVKRIKTRDTVISFIIILISSIAISFIVYWLMNSVKYAAIAAIIFPVLGIVLSISGITSATGFRSATLQLIELNNSLVALTPVSKNNDDISDLSTKYKEIDAYRKKVEGLGRDFVNGELAMFWEWDASTAAKTARARNFVDKVKQE